MKLQYKKYIEVGDRFWVWRCHFTVEKVEKITNNIDKVVEKLRANKFYPFIPVILPASS